MAFSNRPTNSPANRPQAPPRPQASQAVALPAARLPSPPLFRELAAAQQFLGELASRVHVLSPVVNLDYIPELYELSVRYVQIDPRLDNYRQSLSGDVYVQKGSSGEVSLAKKALDRIAAAAGITWHPTLSRRLDDRSDPHYCHYRAVGLFQDIDGSVRTLTGEKEIDLRDGNPGIFTTDRKRMKRKWANGQATNEIENEGYVAGWSPERLEGAREHILAMAESKAKNRVIRGLGIKQKYKPEELAKPFAVLKIVMTGRSSDPELERIAKSAILHDALAKSKGMFGPDVAAPPASIERQLPEPEMHAPPPLREREPEDDDLAPDDSGPIDVTDCGCPDAPAGVHLETCKAPEWKDL